MATKHNVEWGDIKVLSTMEAIRKRPGMYVSYKKDPAETNVFKTKWLGNDLKDPHSLTNLVIEAMCLSRAFASIGTVSEITVKVTNGTEVLIIDNGPGLSMKKDRPDKTLIEILMTELHACKNLKHESIKDFCDSGIVVVNALCSYFYVTNTVDHLANSIWYKKGELELPPFVNHIANTDGLSFKFKFDPEIFGDLKIDKQDLIAEIEKIKATTPAKITLEFDN